jgi:hypothetical protein
MFKYCLYLTFLITPAFGQDKDAAHEQRIRNERRQRILNANPQYVNCDSNTPTINLELSAGPLHSIPRDHQDGLGTCYANTAKNLLAALSGGEINASFLDMALQHQLQSDRLSRSGLDGGHSCETLEAIASRGYCPQEFSPLEGGEQNPLHRSLLGGKSDLEAQQLAFYLVRNYFRKSLDLESGGDARILELKKRSPNYISAIKANPDLKIPIPLLTPPDLFQLGAMHSIYKVKEEREVFMQDYHATFARLRPLLAEAIVKEKKLKDIMKLYQQQMRSFFDKYDPDLAKEMRESFERNLQRADQLRAARTTLQQLKSLGLDYQTSADLELICTENPLVEYLDSLAQLSRHIWSLGGDAHLLLSPAGKMNNDEEIMQLLIAPSCLHQQNRRPLAFQFDCWRLASIRQGEPRTKELRSEIIISLLQGQAVGNTIFQGTQLHINTIVGMRFNQELERCEYLVRESQTGRSEWESESRVFEHHTSLTLVERK